MKAFALVAENQPAALTELPDPELAPDAALIRIRAASVNGFDVFQAAGGLMAMMPHELPAVIGRDLAGVVEAVGSDRTDVAVGDDVLGFVKSTPPLHLGTWAEAIAGGEKLILTRKPAGIDWATAAAIPLAAATALDAVEAVDPKPDETILVMGATGGVGSFAVQLAAQRGARVIASAKPGQDDAFVRSLGAADTIDYTQPGLVDTVRRLVPEGLTGFIDGVSRGEAFMELAVLVRGGGRVATTLGAADVEALASRDVRATNLMGTPTPEKLSSLAGQVAVGRLKAPIQATFALADASKALDAFRSGTRGKLVLTVS